MGDVKSQPAAVSIPGVPHGQEEFAKAVLHGLGASIKSLPSRFLYDQRGSELFEEICDLPEYYPTRTETAILQANADDMTRDVPAGSALDFDD